MLELVLSASGSAALYSCVLMCVPRQCTSLSIPSADLPRDRAKPPLFKLHGPNVRAGPLTIILTIRDDDIKIVCVSQIVVDCFVDQSNRPVLETDEQL